MCNDAFELHVKMENRVGAITVPKEQNELSQIMPLGCIHHPNGKPYGFYPWNAAVRLGLFILLRHWAVGREGVPDLGQFQPQMDLVADVSILESAAGEALTPARQLGTLPPPPAEPGSCLRACTMSASVLPCHGDHSSMACWDGFPGSLLFFLFKITFHWLRAEMRVRHRPLGRDVARVPRCFGCLSVLPHLSNSAEVLI